MVFDNDSFEFGVLMALLQKRGGLMYALNQVHTSLSLLLEVFKGF